ncbi:MAG: hypothetical protein LBL17_03920 [Coxiellaceae bacterium]|jgi:transcriptional antiterminator RfaH|nr:hypothetical protein [Coxiellaceae bacterium]
MVIGIIYQQFEKNRRGGKSICSVEAFFPRYLFIQLNQGTDNCGSIGSTIGVSYMMCFGEIPAVVPKDLVNCLKSHEDQEGLQPNPSCKLTSGNKVEVISGPFTGQQGIYQKLKGLERVIVLLGSVDILSITF